MQAMPRLDLSNIEPVNRTSYPPPHDKAVDGRWQQRFGALAGFAHLGANMVRLDPGAWSSQRHWHHGEDELVIMLEGEAVLVEDGGETVLRAGDVCTWAAGAANGHCIQNRGHAPCRFLAVSAGDADAGGEYSDIDMVFGPAGYTRKDGTPY
jgi:uncharacterized cupin superfamily protein